MFVYGTRRLFTTEMHLKSIILRHKNVDADWLSHIINSSLFWFFFRPFNLHLCYRMNDYYLNFTSISRRDYVTYWLDEDNVLFVLDQHAELPPLDYYSASLLKQQSVDRHVAPLWHIVLIPNQPVFVLSP